MVGMAIIRHRPDAARHSHTAALHPGNDRKIEAAVVGRTRAAAGRVEHKQSVTWRNFQTGLFLPGLDVLGKDTPASWSGGGTFQTSHVHQDAARDDAFFQVVETKLGASPFFVDRLFQRVSVVQLSVVAIVAERIEVRHATMDVELLKIAAESVVS